MPLFKAYFLPDILGPVDADLGLNADAITVFVEKTESEVSEEASAMVHVSEVIAAEDFFMGQKKIRFGDIVWRNWTLEYFQRLPADELERHMRAYSPIWEPGPGWLDLRQEKWGDVDLRRND